MADIKKQGQHRAGETTKELNENTTAGKLSCGHCSLKPLTHARR
jgi:hypothetical protein